jgi:hypothetical protein
MGTEFKTRATKFIPAFVSGGSAAENREVASVWAWFWRTAGFGMGRARRGLLAGAAGLALVSGVLIETPSFGQAAAKKPAAKKKVVAKVEKGPSAAKGGVLPKSALTIVLKSTAEGFADIEHLFKLAAAPDQSKTLVETIDLFLKGVNRQKPVSVQSYVAGTNLKHMISLPIADAKSLKEFLKNLNDVDLVNKPVAGALNLFEIKGLIEAGAFLRFDPKIAYAVIAEWRDEAEAYKTIPDAALLGTDDLVVLIEGSAAQSAERKTAFSRLRKESVDAIKRGPKETQTAFDLRKQAVLNQLDELERFFVEAETIRLGWTTDVPGNVATLTIDLTPLPGTDLAKSADLLGTHANEFQGVSAEGSVVTGDINFPLDELRKKQLAANIPLTVAALDEDTEADSKLTAAEKTAGKQLAAAGGELAAGLGRIGVLNGFIRVYPSGSGKFVTLAGGKVEDSSKMVDLLKAAAERLGGADRLSVDVDSEGDVKIHALSLAAYQKEYPELIAEDGKMYIGLTPTKMWLAGGDGALEKLKAAIQANAKETPSVEGSVAKFDANIAPWLKILDRRLGTTGDAALRKLALEAFAAGKDTWGLNLVKTGKKVTVSVRFDEGVLRMSGKVGAKFVKESLE